MRKALGPGRRLPVAALGVAALAGCGGAPDRTEAVVRDSAGIAVVDHGLLDPDRLPTWTTDSTARVRIGTVTGEEQYQFHRILDARRLADRSILVVDRSYTLRMFDEGGRHLWSAGGEGEGPGEFRYPHMVRALGGDSLVVWDGASNRLSIFMIDGTFVRDAKLQGVEGYALAWGLAGPRRLLIEARKAERTRVDGHEALLHPSDFYLVDLEGRVARELGRRMYAVNFQEVDGNGAFSPAIFATSAVIAPSPGGLWYGDTETDELRDETGPDEIRRIVRWQGPDRTIGDRDVDAVLARWSEEAGNDPALRQWLTEYGETHPRAKTYPAYEKLFVDRAGRLWLQDYVKPHADDGVRRWTIMSADGTRTLGRLVHPSTVEPRDAGEDWLLGVERDDLDVERVVLYGIIAQ